VAFDLLQDFWPSLAELEINGVDPAGLDVDLIDNDVRIPLTAVLDEVAGPVDTYDFKWLRSRIAEMIREDEFCITLDHGIYFPRADFQLDLSRTAPDLRHTEGDNLARLPRDVEDLPTQLAHLRSALSTRRIRRVVLADDGISTGKTLGMVISRCRDYDIDVRRVVVCCNNMGLRSIDGVRVLPIVKQTPGRPWLNERDLYWGLPRSGVTLAARGYSIPFSADSRFVRQRIGVESQVDEFRAACLRANIRLWELFEKQAGGRRLYCEDCSSLRLIPSLLEQRHARHGNTRVVELLARLLEGSDALDFDAPMTAVSS
jgi:hypothetical protein